MYWRSSRIQMYSGIQVRLIFNLLILNFSSNPNAMSSPDTVAVCYLLRQTCIRSNSPVQTRCIRTGAGLLHMLSVYQIPTQSQCVTPDTNVCWPQFPSANAVYQMSPDTVTVF